MDDRQVLNDQVKEYTGFTYDALTEAFNMVKLEGDWKGPIDALITRDQIAIVQRAIKFFAATESSITPTRNPQIVCVTSVGYRKGPAGDK